MRDFTDTYHDYAGLDGSPYRLGGDTYEERGLHEARVEVPLEMSSIRIRLNVAPEAVQVRVIHVAEAVQEALGA